MQTPTEKQRGLHKSSSSVSKDRKASLGNSIQKLLAQKKSPRSILQLIENEIRDDSIVGFNLVQVLEVVPYWEKDIIFFPKLIEQIFENIISRGRNYEGRKLAVTLTSSLENSGMYELAQNFITPINRSFFSDAFVFESYFKSGDYLSAKRLLETRNLKFKKLNLSSNHIVEFIIDVADENLWAYFIEKEIEVRFIHCSPKEIVKAMWHSSRKITGKCLATVLKLYAKSLRRGHILEFYGEAFSFRRSDTHQKIEKIEDALNNIDTGEDLFMETPPEGSEAHTENQKILPDIETSKDILSKIEIWNESQETFSQKLSDTDYLLSDDFISAKDLIDQKILLGEACWEDLASKARIAELEKRPDLARKWAELALRKRRPHKFE